MQKDRLYTKRPMIYSSYRLPKRDNDLLITACSVSGMSRSEFLRQALREKALKVIQQRVGDQDSLTIDESVGRGPTADAFKKLSRDHARRKEIKI